MNQSRLEGLDALRGFAALIVLIYHLCEALGVRSMFPRGYLAVDFFFMLSGFIMARTYGRRLEEGLSLPTFMGLRWRKLWPIAAFGSILGLATFQGPWQAAVAGLLLMPWFAGATAFTLNTPVWSLHFELFANLVHRFIERHLTLVLVISWPLFAMATAVHGSAAFGMMTEHFSFGYARVLASYSLGVFLFRQFGDTPPARLPWLILILPAMIWIPTAKLDVVIAAAMALVIIGGLSFNPRWGPAIGAISFPLYAVHHPLLFRFHPWWGLLLSLILAVIIARLLALRQQRKDAARQARIGAGSESFPAGGAAGGGRACTEPPH